MATVMCRFFGGLTAVTMNLAEMFWLKKSHIRMVLMRLEYLLYILRKGQTQ